MKKRHLDPDAKRDFSVLFEQDRDGIRRWLKRSRKVDRCPYIHCYVCYVCKALFPETKTAECCPCYILYVKDVIKIAKQAIGDPL